MTDRTDDLAEAVGAMIRSLPGRGDFGRARLDRLSGGASRQTFLVSSEDADPQLVLQVRRAGALESSLPFALEARLLRAAADAGVAVPPVVAASGLDGTGPIDDRTWMLSELVAGETIARKLLRDDAWARARDVLVADCGRALAGVHGIDPTAFPELRPSNPVDESRAIIAMIDEPHPAFELALRWLDDHAPPPAPTTVVHGDFRLGNLIVGPEGLAAVIDWELAHLGDPHEDLGWVCVKAWRFGAPGVVAGLGTVDELLDAYREAGGPPVDPAALHWWMVAGTLRWGAICMIQAQAHLSGANRSVELAAIGRRVCETELDLLELLGVADAGRVADLVARASASPVAPAAGLHGRPSAEELIEAVREYIEGPVRGQATGQVAFHTRVAARVLAMVEREVTLGPGQEAAHTSRLAGLGVGSDGGLVDAIRSGLLDDRSSEVASVVLVSVVDKLLVANPDYLG